MRSRGLVVSVLIVALCALVASPSRADESSTHGTYLALGDSLAYGMQVGKFKSALANNSLDAANFVGYVDVFAAELKKRDPALAVVDFGCPGETTSSYLAGPCAFATTGSPFATTPLPLHQPYLGAQGTAAVAYLQTHAGSVRTITIDIGINDVRAVEAACATEADKPACYAMRWPPARERIAARLRTIFAQVRAAAPKAEIYALTAYNWLSIVDPATDALVVDLDTDIGAAAMRSEIETVDVFGAFDRTGNAEARICALTLYCGPTHDLHPSDLGYRTIGDLLIARAKR